MACGCVIWNVFLAWLCVYVCVRVNMHERAYMIEVCALEWMLSASVSVTADTADTEDTE